jgi:glycosyltransferase involved in cell wall biosynthesis
MDNKILYFGNFKFPYGNAAGSRVLGNGYSLRSLGNKVIFVGFDQINSIYPNQPRVYDGFEYHSLVTPNLINRILFYRYLNEIKIIIKSENINIIILYGNPVISLIQFYLIYFCKKNKIKLVIDIADWHSSNSGPYLGRFIKYLDISFRMKYLNKKSDGIITVSSHLRNYYKSKSLPVIVVPPLVNLNKFKDLKFDLDSKITTLIYVGQPFPNINGRSVSESAYKDRLDIVIDSLYELKNKNFIFNIYGISKIEYLKVIKKHQDVLDVLWDRVLFHGIVENSKVLSYIANSDFSILYRESNRLSNSGFPTKFVECISCGTPMITTFTSDLEQYITINRLGFGVDPKSRNDFTDLLENSLSLSRDEIVKMKKYCYSSHAFSFENFIVDFEKFLKLI